MTAITLAVLASKVNTYRSWAANNARVASELPTNSARAVHHQSKAEAFQIVADDLDFEAKDIALKFDNMPVWTLALEAARLHLCQFIVDQAGRNAIARLHPDLAKRLLEAEQCLTILGDIAVRVYDTDALNLPTVEPTSTKAVT